MQNSLIQELIDAAGDYRENQNLSEHTTVQVGGPAKLVVFPAETNALQQLLLILNKQPETEVALLGGGANCFADSAGFDGVIISTTHWQDDYLLDGDLLVLGTGADLQQVAQRAADSGWGGIDFMAEVPGTLGGAVAINAGTITGGYVADCLQWVETLTWQGESRRYTSDQMEFGYRTSRLLYGREIVTRAAFRLKSCESLQCQPTDLKKRFQKVMDERHAKFPYQYPNSGSSFRSPGEPLPPVGKLIEDLEMRGLRIGDAQISEMHGNFIVNRGQATSDDILAIMEAMVQAVFEHHAVWLKPEVQYLCNRHRPRPKFYQKNS